MKPDQGKLPGNPVCPKCKSKADGYTKTMTGGLPRTGDIVVCVYCGNVGMYEVDSDKVSIRTATNRELQQIYIQYPDLEKRVERIRQLAEQLVKMKQKKLN